MWPQNTPNTHTPLPLSSNVPTLNDRKSIEHSGDYVNRQVLKCALVPQTRDYQYNCLSLAAHEKRTKIYDWWPLFHFIFIVRLVVVAVAVVVVVLLFYFLANQIEAKTLISANKRAQEKCHMKSLKKNHKKKKMRNIRNPSKKKGNQIQKSVKKS